VAEQHVIRALRDKRSELAGLVKGLEQKLGEHRTTLTHLDATLRLFDPQIRPEEIRPRQPRTRSVWFRPGECLRRIYDVLREAPEPLTTRAIADRIIAMKDMTNGDERSRALIRKVVLGSLNRPGTRSSGSRPRAWSGGGCVRRRGRVASSRRNRPTVGSASPGGSRHAPARRC
jgi:hypothetical protein